MRGILIAWILIMLIACVGWILNIVSIFNSSFDSLTGILVLRVIGVFLAPIGAILGFF
jgi:hypothetical protein